MRCGGMVWLPIRRGPDLLTFRKLRAGRHRMAQAFDVTNLDIFPINESEYAKYAIVTCVE